MELMAILCVPFRLTNLFRFGEDRIDGWKIIVAVTSLTLYISLVQEAAHHKPTEASSEQLVSHKGTQLYWDKNH